MIPTNFKESNRVLGPPPGWTEDMCSSLFIHRSKEHHMDVSCWKLTDEEVRAIQETGRVYLMVCGTHPPVKLQVESPFAQE